MTFTKGYGKIKKPVSPFGSERKLPNALAGKGVKKIGSPGSGVYSTHYKKDANLNIIPKTVAKTVKGAAKKIGKVYR